MPELEFGQGLSEIQAPGPVQSEDEGQIAHYRSLEDEVASRRRTGLPYRFPPDDSSTSVAEGESENGATPQAEEEEDEYDEPAGVANLTDTAPVAIIKNPSETHRYSQRNLEEELGHGSERHSLRGERPASAPSPGHSAQKVSRFQTDVFIYSHLVSFSIFGTLARLGLSALTAYPASTIQFASLWPNFAGSLVLGFLSEGAELFHHPKPTRSLTRPAPAPVKNDANKSPSDTECSVVGSAEKEVAVAAVSPLPRPLHIGLATGFCGCFTSYSAWMRDSFEALAGMPAPGPSPGRDAMNVFSVLITTIALSAAGLKMGAHVAIFLQSYERRLPMRFVHGMDRISVVLAVGLWAGAVIMAIVPPDRPSGPPGTAKPWRDETWRGRALFALVFAPLGCLLRFQASMRLNNRIVGFPLGTFCVNMFGTLVLAVVWDLQRLPSGSVSTLPGRDRVSCQVLQGIEDGFCGCLTTVSTWILELSSLRRNHSYRYGMASIITSLAIVVVVMGCLKWTAGLGDPICVAL